MMVHATILFPSALLLGVAPMFAMAGRHVANEELANEPRGIEGLIPLYLERLAAGNISNDDSDEAPMMRRGGASLDCLDEEGKPVDFYYAFKYPGGYTHAYMDKNHKVLKESKNKMNDPNSAIFRTLQQLYKNHGSASYAMWNDHAPFASHATGGPHAHAKGVLAFAGGAGFWLTHSVPMFPVHAKKYKKDPFEDASDKYGQSFLCININKRGLEAVNLLMESNWPTVYDVKDNAHLGKVFEWATKGTRDKETQTRVVTVTSRGHQEFTAFGKAGGWKKDLFHDLVAPTFDKDFQTETWQNGIGPLPDFVAGRDGKRYDITNIQDVEFPGASWSEHQDHSKWGLSTDSSVFCVGDINRQNGQRSRGGGTICIEDKTIGKQMAHVMKD